MNGYTIGPVADAVGVPTSTIRFYERTGLFRPDARTDSNYRLYSKEAVERLRFVRSAQATGFSLEDIRELLSLIPSDEPPCDDVVAVTRKRLAEVRQRLKDLRRMERVLAKSLSDCCSGDRPDLCNDLLRLRGGNGADCTPARKKSQSA